MLGVLLSVLGMPAWLDPDELVNSNMEIYLMMLGVCTTPSKLLTVPTWSHSHLNQPQPQIQRAG